MNRTLIQLQVPEVHFSHFDVLPQPTETKSWISYQHTKARYTWKEPKKENKRSNSLSPKRYWTIAALNLTDLDIEYVDSVLFPNYE